MEWYGDLIAKAVKDMRKKEFSGEYHYLIHYCAVDYVKIFESVYYYE